MTNQHDLSGQARGKFKYPAILWEGLRLLALGACFRRLLRLDRGCRLAI